jgi:hypothetical protein
VDRFRVGVRNFCLLRSVQTGYGSCQPHIEWLPVTMSIGVEWPKRASDISLLSRARRLGVGGTVTLLLYMPYWLAQGEL